MTDRNDLPQPEDHLPPKSERQDHTPAEQREYPDTGETSSGDSRVSPATAAEPDKPNRHGVDKLPPTGR
jgi:hypothetical protein